MKSSPTLVEESLPDGVPIYFTVSVIDDYGNVNMAVCHLDTYDMTIPEGATISYPTSSNIHNIRANFEVGIRFHSFSDVI